MYAAHELPVVGEVRWVRPENVHLTLGRARGRPVALTAVETPPTVPKFSVRHLELVKSVPNEAGTAYSTLANYLLSEGRD